MISKQDAEYIVRGIRDDKYHMAAKGESGWYQGQGRRMIYECDLSDGGFLSIRWMRGAVSLDYKECDMNFEHPRCSGAVESHLMNVSIDDGVLTFVFRQIIRLGDSEGLSGHISLAITGEKHEMRKRETRLYPCTSTMAKDLVRAFKHKEYSDKWEDFEGEKVLNLWSGEQCFRIVMGQDPRVTEMSSNKTYKIAGFSAGLSKFTINLAGGKSFEMKYIV